MNELLGILGVLLVLYWATVVLTIISQNRDPTETIAWIAILVLLPVVGVGIYFFMGRDWKGWLPTRQWFNDWVRLRLPYMERIYAEQKEYAGAWHPEAEHSVSGRIARAVETSSLAPVLPATSFDVFPSGSEYFPVLLADLAKAQKSIHMQYFIWERDELTAAITDVLLGRLEAGVEVRILNDFLGCLTYKKDELKRLAAAGATVSYDMTQFGRLNYRNHRKITVIDGTVGHSGGFNIGQEYIDGGDKYPAWRDTGLRITGPAIVDLAKLFADRWYEVSKESLYRDEYFAAGFEMPVSPLLPVQTVAHGVEDPLESARRAHAVAISGASERAWLQSPYFIPDQGTYDALVNSALSGVDVRLMMTDWPDKKMALRAAESYYAPLLKAGGRIFRYTKGFFHAKSITVDSRASAVGTMNLDMRSLKLHKELMVWCYDPAVARRCEQIFEEDLQDCREVALQEVEEWNAIHRWTNSAARLGSNIM